MTTYDPARQIATWFQVMSSGCHFAGHFAREDSRRIAFATLFKIDDATPFAITQHFEQAALRDHAGVVVLPTIQREAEIHSLLDLLTSSDRWHRQELNSNQPGRLAVALHWRTQGGLWSRSMGLAPLLTMPLTRRAPFVAIAAWPGGPKKPATDTVGFGDMRSNLGDQHKATFAKTRDLSSQMLADDPDKAQLGEIAFCLSRLGDQPDSQPHPPSGNQ